VDELGCDFAMGEGQWHLSIEDKEKGHLINGCYSNAPFARLLADNLVTLQQLCPALFFRPKLTERLAFLETEYIRASSNRKLSTVLADHERYMGGGNIFELRAANLAPYVPTLMLLHAIEQSLHGRAIDIHDYNEQAVTLDIGTSIVRGKGCHFDDIKTTQQSGYLEQHFPALSDALIERAVRNYERFLRIPTWSNMYDDAGRAKALQRLARAYPATQAGSASIAIRSGSHFREFTDRLAL
jgi:hypothetical protein